MQPAQTQCCGTDVFLREVTGASDALVVDVDLKLLDHVGQPAGHGPQQGVHVGHVWTKQHSWVPKIPRVTRSTDIIALCKIKKTKTEARIRKTALTLSLLLPNDALALPVQELQMIRHHPLLAFMDDFGIGAGVQVLPTSHLFVFQPPQHLEGARKVQKGQSVK